MDLSDWDMLVLIEESSRKLFAVHHLRMVNV